MKKCISYGYFATYKCQVYGLVVKLYTFIPFYLVSYRFIPNLLKFNTLQIRRNWPHLRHDSSFCDKYWKCGFRLL